MSETKSIALRVFDWDKLFYWPYTIVTLKTAVIKVILHCLNMWHHQQVPNEKEFLLLYTLTDVLMIPSCPHSKQFRGLWKGKVNWVEKTRTIKNQDVWSIECPHTNKQTKTIIITKIWLNFCNYYYKNMVKNMNCKADITKELLQCPKGTPSSPRSHLVLKNLFKLTS